MELLQPPQTLKEANAAVAQILAAINRRIQQNLDTANGAAAERTYAQAMRCQITTAVYAQVLQLFKGIYVQCPAEYKRDGEGFSKIDITSIQGKE